MSYTRKTVYLAARYGRRAELQGYCAQLETAGYTVTSRWLNGSHEGDHRDNGEDPLSHDFQERLATEDLQDLYNATTVLCFTEPPRSPHSRGGRHVEAGLAIAWDKEIYVIGPEENVFYALPQCTVVPDFLTCFTLMQQEGAWLLHLGEDGEGLEHVAPFLVADEPKEGATP